MEIFSSGEADSDTRLRRTGSVGPLSVDRRPSVEAAKPLVG